MWISSIAIFGLLALSSAYVPGGSGPYGLYGNFGGNYGNYGGNFGNIEKTLDRVESSIERLVERGRTREDRINRLQDSTSDNRGLEEDVHEIAQEDINDKIDIQNGRFARLGERIARIQGLQTELGKLEYQVAAIRVSVNQTDAKGIASLATVNGLGQNVYPVDEENIVDAIEAGRIRDGLEGVIRLLGNNTRKLDTLEYRVDQFQSTLRYTTGAASEVNLALKSGVAAQTLDYPGFARNAGFFSTGFRFVRSGKRNYNDETENLFYHVNADIDNGIQINAFDLSDSGWYTNNIYGTTAAFRRVIEPLEISAPYEAVQ